MCGIFTAFVKGESLDRSLLEVCLKQLRHRGPDDSGVFMHRNESHGWSLWLGHRRLSVFDLSSEGKQPMSDSRGRTIVYNGEIFNWPEIRKGLENVGYGFHSRTDTEVILAAYDHWGEDCVQYFNGFWAFVIFDNSETNGQRIMLSRDRFGIKPLYYRLDHKRFVVSSEISPIWTFYGDRPKPNITRLADYLIDARSHDSDDTVYESILELEPGHSAFVNLPETKITKKAYWQLPKDESKWSDSEALERFSELVEDSVRIRLRSDRNIGLTLSGGVDSSVIAVAASRVHCPREMRAFTSHFPYNSILDESYYAKLVANQLGFDHVCVEPVLGDLEVEERHLTRHQELLYTSFSMLVNWTVMREISRNGITVFLTGQGGDEMLLGYERYLVPWLRSQIKNKPLSILGNAFDAVRATKLNMKEWLGYLAYFGGTAIRNTRYRRDSKNIFSEGFINAARRGPQSYPTEISELQEQELRGSQLRRLLRYDDRTSSAFGLEARPALLDHRLVEFSYSLGWEHKIRHGWTKHLMRRYLDTAGLHEIAWRSHKLGYPAPTSQWLEKLWRLRHTEITTGLQGSLFCQGLTPEKIPPRLKFTVYNLISTQIELGWQND